MKKLNGIRWCAAALTLLLGACSLAPPLKTPVVPTAVAYKELGPWTQAQPADRLPRDSWWSLYDNAELDQLQQRLIAGNPTLAATLANYAQARALSDQARAGLFPTLGLGAGVERARESLNDPLRGPTTPTYYNANTLGGSASYELDLWGQIRNEVAAGEANAAASAADLENARLSLIAQLVDDYIQLRSLDHDSAILDETVKTYARALSLTEQRHDAGIAPGLDVSQAQTQLNVARSQAAQTLAQRALMEHAIAALLGVSASTFSINPQIVAIKLPQVPSGVPSTLLQRRPDIAAAQRRMIAANANIGVARAAYFPTLTLGAQGGFQSNAFGNLLSAPSSFWAIGPNALLSVFDGGLRRAQVAQARAEFDASAAQLPWHRRQRVSAGGRQPCHPQSLPRCGSGGEGRGRRRATHAGPVHDALRQGCDRLSDRRHLPNGRAADPAGSPRPRYRAAARQRRPDPCARRRLGRPGAYGRAGERGNRRLNVELTPDVPDPLDSGFLGSLPSNQQRLRNLRQRPVSDARRHDDRWRGTCGQAGAVSNATEGPRLVVGWQ